MGVREAVNEIEQLGNREARVSIRMIFVHRVVAWAKEIASTAPEAVLAESLESPTMRGGLVHLLSEVGVDSEISEVTRLREASIARALAEREVLRERVGGFRPTTWVSEHLGVSRQAVDKRRRGGRLLAIETSDGSFEYPFLQFDENGVVKGVPEVLEVFREEGVENVWEVLSFLANPSPALSGKSVIEVLQEARTARGRERMVVFVRAALR